MKCPICGADMMKRQNRTTEEWFYGCTRYPACRGSREISEYEKMIEAGAATLFDIQELS